MVDGLRRGDEGHGRLATAAVTSDENRRTTQDRFIWCFGLGFAVILTSKLLLRDPILGGMLAAGLGIVLMWWYKRKEQQDRREEEWPRLGDEVYYLGLLFTLTSLCVALVALFLLDRGGDLARRTDEMIGSFGIALLTTMAGIVLRTVLQRPGGTDPEIIIRIPSVAVRAETPAGATRASNGVGAGVSLGGATVNLDKYAYELRRQLDSAATAFASLGNKVYQQAHLIQKHADEFSADLKHRADAFLGEIETKAIAAADGLEERTNAEIGRLQTVYAEAARGAEAAARSAEAQQEGMQRVLGTLTAHVTGLEGSIAQIRSASAGTADQFDSIAEKVASAVERLDGLARVQRQHDEVLESAVGTLRSLIRAADQGLEGQRNLEKAVRSIGDVAATAERYASAMQEAGREVERTNADLKNLQVVVQQEGMGLAQAVRQAIAAVEEARRREQEAHRRNRWVSRLWRRASGSVSR